MEKLAIDGGVPAKSRPFGAGRRYDEAEAAEVAAVFVNGTLNY